MSQLVHIELLRPSMDFQCVVNYAVAAYIVGYVTKHETENFNEALHCAMRETGGLSIHSEFNPTLLFASVYFPVQEKQSGFPQQRFPFAFNLAKLAFECVRMADGVFEKRLHSMKSFHFLMNTLVVPEDLVFIYNKCSVVDECVVLTLGLGKM